MPGPRKEARHSYIGGVMGKYITSEAVLIRLRGKVKVTSDPDREPDRMPLLLLNRLILEAEGAVEFDLSTRYAAPFQTIQGCPFDKLPRHPTQEVLKTLCELLSVIRVLETDFGRGSASDSSKYAESCQDRYDRMIHGDEEKGIPGLITLRKETFNVFRTPPLPGLKSSWQVSQVDTGFAGYVTRSDDTGHGGYPIHQINSPGENFWNGFIEAEERDWVGGDPFTGVE